MSNNTSLDTNVLQINENIVARTYWNQRVQGFTPAAYLTARPIDAMFKQFPALTSLKLKLSAEVESTLQVLAPSLKAKQIVLLSALSIYLHKLSAASDLLVFTPCYTTQEAHTVIPIRIKLQSSQHFRQHITDLKEHILVDFSYADYAAEAIWNQLPAAEKVSHRVGMLLSEIQSREVFRDWHPGIVFIFKTSGEAELEIEYNADQFDLEYIESVAGLFNLFLKQLLLNQETSIAQLPLYQDEAIHASILESAPSRSQEVPASFVQERLWFLDSFEGGTDSYNIPLVLHFRGRVNPQMLEQAINYLLDEYELLSAKFILKEENPCLIQGQKLNFSLTLQTVANEAELRNTIEEARGDLFELDKQLFRAHLYQLSPERSTLLFVLHHLVADRYSARFIALRTLSIYRELLNVGSYSPRTAAFPYSAYAHWQRTTFGAPMLALLTKSKQRLGTQLKALELPLDQPRGAVHRFKGQFLKFAVPDNTRQDILKYTQTSGLDIQVVMMGALMLLLHKYTRHEEIVIGVAHHNRNHPSISEVLGPIDNPIVLSATVQDENSVHQFLQQAQVLCQQSKAEALLPLEKLAHEFPQTKDMSRNALIDVLFRYENTVTELIQLESLNIALEEPYLGHGRYDLDLLVQHSSQIMELTLTYNALYFKEVTIQALVKHYLQLLQSMLKEPECRIEALQLMSAAEKQLILNDFNQTSVPYPQDGNIISLFEAQVAKTPDQVAIKYANFELSYRELDKLSGQFAAYLVKYCKVQAGDLIGIMMEREAYLIPVIYGILKAGCAYIPIDPHFPAERIQSIVDDSGLKQVFARGDLILPQLNFSNWLDLDVLLDEIKKMDQCSMPIKGKDLAYVIYTSGSTGRPKGVMIEHHSVVNRLLWMQKAYPVSGEDVFIQKTPIVFDVSVWELFWWAFNGASLYLLPPGGEKNVAIMLEAIEKQGISVMHFVPSMLGYFLPEVEKETSLTQFHKLRMVFTSGEALQASHVEMFDRSLWRWNQTRLINLYGPTEATVDVSHYECDFEQPIPASIPIGKPIDNIRFYITDQQGKLLPIGLSGELLIAGAGLARGYLNNEKLSQEKFILPQSDIQERVYKTGDLAKWAPDGNVLFLGRIDNQVKLRGLRIELGEIEYCLSLQENIHDCAVLMKEMNGEQYLVAYYTSANPLMADSLRGFLLQRLPDYMIPSFFIHMEKFPLSVNGKLDRKALPSPQVEESVAFEPAITKTEWMVAEIWSDVLKQNAAQISVTRSFFEVGGHSLLAMAVVNKLLKRHNVAISLKEFLSLNTIRELARHIDLQSWLSEDKQGQETNNGITEIFI